MSFIEMLESISPENEISLIRHRRLRLGIWLSFILLVPLILFPQEIDPVHVPEIMHSHNAFLQYWIDAGYFGAVVFIFLFVVLLHECVVHNEPRCRMIPVPVFGFLLYLLVVGVTDIVPIVYNPVMFAVFLLVGTVGVNAGSQ